MKTFVVLKAYPGAKPGAEVQMAEADAAAYVADGYLAEKDPAAKAAVEGEVDSLVETMADALLSKTLTKFNEKAKAAAPFNLSVPDRPAAEAKDHGTLGEWLWCAAGQAQTREPRKAEHCKTLLIGKYQTRVNENFGEEWSQTVSKGAGGQGVTQEGVSKASVQVENVGSLGGLTVPTQFSAEFFRLATPKSLFMGRCKRYTMTGKELLVPAIDYSTGGSGASPYLGGMAAQWTGENTGFTQENAKVRQIKFSANLLAGYTQSSRTLLADSAVALEQVLTDLFAQAIAYNVDLAVFSGDGVDKPEGITKAASTKSFQRADWSTNGNLLTDMATADSYLIPELEAEAMWLLAPSFKKKLYPMTDASGKVVFIANGAPGPEGPAAMRPSMKVFGKDVFYSQLAASAGSTNDVNLIIPSLYGMALREDIEIGVSEHFAWTTNLLTWRFLFRGDGRSLLNTYLTLQNNDVVAPAVTITT